MRAYLLRRIWLSFLVLVGVSILSFSVMHLVPGDPVYTILGRAASAQRAETLREQLGLNDSILVQYGRFVQNALRGDLGESIRTERGVLDSILEQVPSTAMLTMSAMLIAITLGLGLGLLASVYQNSWVDTGTMILAISGVSIPHFWLALLLILLFSVELNWLPSVASHNDWRGLILPALTLGLAEAGVITRLVRASMTEQLRSNYITVARSKGLYERTILSRHALRNALIPVVSLISLQFGFLLSGSVVVESIFARQGIGRLAVTAINSRDFPLVQGLVLFIALIYVVINTLTDFMYVLLDPRMRLQ